MIRVLDEEKSVAFYRLALGLEVAHRAEFDKFSLIYLRNAMSTFELELTINHGRSVPYLHGDGYGHLAVAVLDVDAEALKLRAAGVQTSEVKSLFVGNDCLARFFFMTDPDGYKIEVIETNLRYR